MALFMDVHHLPEPASPEDVAGAHQKDLEIQGQHGVEYINYWLTEDGKTIYCLASAPDAAPTACTPRRTACSPTRSTR